MSSCLQILPCLDLRGDLDEGLSSGSSKETVFQPDTRQKTFPLSLKEKDRNTHTLLVKSFRTPQFSSLLLKVMQFNVSLHS